MLIVVNRRTKSVVYCIFNMFYSILIVFFIFMFDFVCCSQPPTTVCRAAKGVCDAVEYCDNGECPTDAKRNGRTCRSQAGACDVPEYCQNNQDDCPPDVIVSRGQTCRAAEGVCDVAEVRLFFYY